MRFSGIRPAVRDGTALQGQLPVLVGLNALYVGFGAVMGVVNGGMPTVLRGQGMDIAAAGWLYLLYLPFGLTFLWAPLVDRLSLPFLTRRLGWIAAMQGIAVLGLVAIAFNEGMSLALLFALGLAVSLAIATMDIALDALAVRGIEPAWRPAAAATKLAALSVGAMIGGGAFVALFGELGWMLAFLLLAALLAVLVAPALGLARHDRDPPDGGKATLLRLLRVPLQRRRLLLLTAACCVLFPIAGLNRLMLVDIGVPMGRIGWIVGTLGPLSMLATSIVSIPLMRHAGLVRSLLLFACLALLSLAALAYGHAAADRGLAMAGAVAIGAGVSGIYVVIAARIIGWAAGPQPATDYAAFYGISRFASTLMTVAAAQVVPLAGWGAFYIGGAAAMIVMTFILQSLIGRND